MEKLQSDKLRNLKPALQKDICSKRVKMTSKEILNILTAMYMMDLNNMNI